MSEDVENATCLLGGETPAHSPKGESTKHNIRLVLWITQVSWVAEYPLLQVLTLVSG
jgi:hypothetical protein